jgi:hypothetical protein
MSFDFFWAGYSVAIKHRCVVIDPSKVCALHRGTLVPFWHFGRPAQPSDCMLHHPVRLADAVVSLLELYG